jgi:hypothetical protein
VTTRRWTTLLAVATLGSWAACKRATPPEPTSAPAPVPQRAPRGVDVYPGLIESGSDDLAVGWTAPWLNGTIVSKDGQRHLVNCADLQGVKEADVQLGPQWERDGFREKSIRCRALALVRRATAPRVGYLADLVGSNDPGDVLPAALSPEASKHREARSWRAADPKLSFDRAAARPNYRELAVRGKYEGLLDWWAMGDFDGDGVADAALFLNLTPSGDPNAPNIIRGFVVTRRQAGGPVTVVERFE